MKKIAFVSLLLLLSASTLFASQRYALLIGIDDYRDDKIRDLKYSEVDAEFLKERLIKYAQYTPENVRLLLGQNATYQNIKNEVYWLQKSVKEEDKVFFYFSGHGTRIPDLIGTEEDGLDEAFCPYDTDYDMRETTVIRDNEIGVWFKGIKSEEIVIVLDCCHSGGAAGRSLENDGSRGLDMVLPEGAAGRGLMEPDADPYSRDLTLDRKIVITASDAHEQSYEDPELAHGVFTYYIGEAIRGEADYDKDKKITSAELYEYTRDQTVAHAEKTKRPQTPSRFGTLNDAVVAEISSQRYDFYGYDPDLGEIALSMGDGEEEPGDLFIIKNVPRFARDLSVSDRKIFKAKVVEVRDEGIRCKVLESFVPDIRISSTSVGDYYGEKVVMGSIFISTDPWSNVRIDGKSLGETPLLLQEIEAGEHTVEFELDHFGYPSHLKEVVTVEGNQTLVLKKQFTKQ